LQLLPALHPLLHSQDVSSTKQTVWLPGKAWALQFDSIGFETKTNEIKADGRRYYLAENHSNNWVVSFFLEVMKGTPAPGECKHSLEEKAKRNASYSSSPLKRARYYESGDFALFEYVIAT
jgi:hypothetical protein